MFSESKQNTFQNNNEEENNLTFLAAGGEHVVFETKDIDWKDEVVKINYLSIKACLDYNNQHNLPLESISSKWKSIYERDTERRKEEFEELKSFFSEHTLSQTTQIARVPINNEQIQLLYTDKEGVGSEPPKGFTEIKELPAVVTFQDKVETKTLKQQYYLQFGDFQHHDLAKEEINSELNNFYFKDQLDYNDEISKSFPPLKKIISLIKEDSQWKAVFKDFAERLIDYTEKTGKAIDLVGKDNVLFFKTTENNFDYKLIDALLADPKSLIREEELFDKWLSGNDPDSNINEVMPDNIHYMKGINALAWISGSNKRLEKLQDHEISSQLNKVISYLQNSK